MADHHFLEFPYFGILKSRIEECSILFYGAMTIRPQFHCTESQVTEFIKVRIERRGLFDELFLK